MNLTTRSFLALTLLAAGSGAVYAQQTLTFSNTSTPSGQPLAVNLEAGSAVSIAPNGNISARCVLGSSSSICAGINAGGGGNAPVVALAASGFSQAPNGNGEYGAGTTFTITPSVSGAEVCVRSVTINAAPAASTGWPATFVLPFNPQVVNLPTASATYSFSIRCYGAGGATTATLANVQTSNVVQPGACGGFVSPLPSGWSRSAVQNFSQVTAVEIGGATWNPFPNSGFSGYLITTSTQYISLGFTTPATEAIWTAGAPVKQFEWQAAQQQGAVSLDRMYMSISSCAGDFRIPPVGQVAPANDTTFARGCRNIRPAFGFPSVTRQTIPYEITTINQASDDTTCRMAPGTTYFLNFIRANALDGTIGTPAEEASCEDGVSNSCGVQARVY